MSLFKGIGARKEAYLHRNGVMDWATLQAEAPRFFRGTQLDSIQRAVGKALERWDAGDTRYIAHALPVAERWRLIQSCADGITYFDIEATGGGREGNAVSTVIGFLHGGELLQEWDYGAKRLLVERIMDESKLFCTFNGGGYDVPFLRKEFKLPLDNPHVDLYPWLRRQGFTGGLKAIQFSQTHLRQRQYADVDGYDAVRLWRLHEQNVPGALEALITYNAEDVIILPELLTEAYHRELDARPYLDVERLPWPYIPSLTTRVDPRIYALLKARTTAETYRAIDFLDL